MRNRVTEMGWDRGRYYIRSRKVNGRVVREYVGTGRVAELAAQLDALEREQRLLDALAVRDEKADLAALEGDMKALSETTDLLARAALLAAGFHRHKRGEWRKRRGQDRLTDP
jgi:hypothetical protein